MLHSPEFPLSYGRGIVLSPRDTAYPVLKSSPSTRELDEVIHAYAFRIGLRREEDKRRGTADRFARSAEDVPAARVFRQTIRRTQIRRAAYCEDSGISRGARRRE